MEAERERLIEELEAFAHTVAHDLKGPLQAIGGQVGILELLTTRAGSDQLLTPLDSIERSVMKMGEIIDSLLLLAKVRTMQDVTIEALDMSAIVERAVDRLQDPIAASGAEVILPDSWDASMGYGPWVEEVWVNYLSNAIKYGGSPPRLEVGSTAGPDREVRLWVRDNGPGITVEQQSRLFVPFARLHPSAGEGHGLGLSIVQRIVDRLGGTVDVDSRCGLGSVFSFTLPECDEHPSPPGSTMPTDAETH